MNEIWEITKPLIPQIILVILTSFITTYITKYFDKKPNEKLELSYNKIYYPLYLLIKKNLNKRYSEIDYIEIRDFLKTKLFSNEKYANRTTVKAFELFDEAVNSNNQKQIRKIYNGIIVANILQQNKQLRKILGYPEPNFLENYKYYPKRLKIKTNYIICCSTIFFVFGAAIVFSEISIFLEICVFILFLCIFSLFINFLYHIWYLAIEFIRYIKNG